MAKPKKTSSARNSRQYSNAVQKQEDAKRSAGAVKYMKDMQKMLNKAAAHTDAWLGMAKTSGWDLENSVNSKNRTSVNDRAYIPVIGTADNNYARAYKSTVVKNAIAGKANQIAAKKNAANATVGRPTTKKTAL
jgi:hypothetical protein